MDLKRQLLADALRPADVAADEATALMRQSFTGADFVEGVTAFVQKRKPGFTGS